MKNALLQIIDEVTENEGFIIDDDSKADWSLCKIREEQAEAQRVINTCESMILHYQNKMNEVRNKLETKTSYLRCQLQQYFEKVPHKSTKTQETYDLPSGKLVKRYPGQEYKRDDEQILKYLEENGVDYFIKIKKSVDWAELKKNLIYEKGFAIDTSGEIVPGIDVIDKDPVFEIKL